MTRVIVQTSASSQSAQVGSLCADEQAELIGSVSNWYELRHPNDTAGVVSKRWTHVIPTGRPPTPTPPPAGSPTFTMDVVDGGTGLDILVRGPDFTLVYDGGSNDDLARGPSNRVLAYLRAVAPTLTTIDHLILSHPHRDPVGLLPDLFAAYQVRHVWDSGRINDICRYPALLTAVRDEPGVEYHSALQDFGTRGYSFRDRAGGCYGNAAPAVTLQLPHASRITNSPIPLGQQATMTILHADRAPHPSPNENSLVVRLDLGGTRVLLMGDAEAGGRRPTSEPPADTSIEGTLLSCYASDLAAQVLVVGHHGSRRSPQTTFLDAVDASAFVVSSGPHEVRQRRAADSDIIAELDARGDVFRTDVNDCRKKESDYWSVDAFHSPKRGFE